MFCLLIKIWISNFKLQIVCLNITAVDYWLRARGHHRRESQDRAGMENKEWADCWVKDSKAPDTHDILLQLSNIQVPNMGVSQRVVNQAGKHVNGTWPCMVVSQSNGGAHDSLNMETGVKWTLPFHEHLKGMIIFVLKMTFQWAIYFNQSTNQSIKWQHAIFILPGYFPSKEF